MNYKETVVCLDQYKKSKFTDYSDKSVILRKSLEELFNIRFNNNIIIDDGMIRFTKFKNFETIHLWMRMLGLDRYTISELYEKGLHVIVNFLEDTKQLLKVIPLNEIRYKRSAILLLFELRNRVENETFCFDHIVLFQELLLEIMMINSTKISTIQKDMWNNIIKNRFIFTKWMANLDSANLDSAI